MQTHPPSQGGGGGGGPTFGGSILSPKNFFVLHRNRGNPCLQQGTFGQTPRGEGLGQDPPTHPPPGRKTLKENLCEERREKSVAGQP